MCYYREMFRSLLKVAIVYILFTTACQAHSWYDPSCCSDQDCHPIASCSELTELPDGKVQWEDKIFDKANVKPSQDGKCHVCIGATGFPYCVYIQLGT